MLMKSTNEQEQTRIGPGGFTGRGEFSFRQELVLIVVILG